MMCDDDGHAFVDTQTKSSFFAAKYTKLWYWTTDDHDDLHAQYTRQTQSMSFNCSYQTSSDSRATKIEKKDTRLGHHYPEDSLGGNFLRRRLLKLSVVVMMKKVL